MNKIWKSHPAECNHCGGNSEICTYEGLDEGWEYDGDEMRCVECKCPGQWNVFDEDSAYESWHDEPGCTCDWCKAHFDKDDKWIE